MGSLIAVRQARSPTNKTQLNVSVTFIYCSVPYRCLSPSRVPSLFLYVVGDNSGNGPDSQPWIKYDQRILNMMQDTHNDNGVKQGSVLLRMIEINSQRAIGDKNSLIGDLYP